MVPTESISLFSLPETDLSSLGSVGDSGFAVRDRSTVSSSRAITAAMVVLVFFAIFAIFVFLCLCWWCWWCWCRKTKGRDCRRNADLDGEKNDPVGKDSLSNTRFLLLLRKSVLFGVVLAQRAK